MKQSMPAKEAENIVEVDGLRVDLRQRALAAVYAWLIPGAGHFYQRRYSKAIMFSVCIITTWCIGMFVGGGRVVYASWKPEDRRWHYIAQVGVGLPALPAIVQAYRASDPGQRGDARGNDFSPWMAPPRNLKELHLWHAATAQGFDLGTLYTMVAGLLNFLVIFDAYAGPMPLPADASKKKTGKDGDDPNPPDDTISDNHKKEPNDAKPAINDQ